MLSPFVLSHLGFLDRADFLVRLAVIPGAFIGALVFLVNGCIEHYADILPRKYRSRSSQDDAWRSLYSETEMDGVREVLQAFSISHGFRAVDTFQFHPDDRLLDILGEVNPDNKYPDCLANALPDADDPTDLILHELLRMNATLRQYVDSAIHVGTVA